MANTIPSAVLAGVIVRIQEALRVKAGILGAVSKDLLPDGVQDNSQAGESVNVTIPPFFTAGSVTPAITPPALPNATHKTKQIALATWSNVNFHLTSREWPTLYDNTSVLARTIESAIEALLLPVRAGVFAAVKAGLMGYQKATTGTSYFNGTDLLANISNAVAILDRQSTPSDRVGVFCAAEVAAARALTSFHSATIAPSAEAARVYGRGLLGTLFGLDLLQEDGVADIPSTHTAGTGASYVLNGAHAKGATSIVVKTGSGTILAGDLITIGNYDYVVTTGVAAAGTAVIAEPGLLEAKSDGDAVTVRDASSTHVIRGFAFCPRGAILVCRTPVVPGEAGEPTVITDPITGIRLKLTRYGGYHASEWEVSLLWGAGTSNARMGARLVAAAS